MLFDDKDDSESTQILKNLIFLKLPLNNKDRDEALPGFAIFIVISIIVCLILLSL